MFHVDNFDFILLYRINFNKLIDSIVSGKDILQYNANMCTSE